MERYILQKNNDTRLHPVRGEEAKGQFHNRGKGSLRGPSQNRIDASLSVLVGPLSESSLD